MNIAIYGKNLDVTDALKEYARRKVGKVARYFNDTPLQAQVTLSIERDRHIVEVTIPLPNNGLLIARRKTPRTCTPPSTWWWTNWNARSAS